MAYTFPLPACILFFFLACDREKQSNNNKTQCNNRQTTTRSRQMGRKTLWVSPFFFFFFILPDRKNRPFISGRKKKEIIFYFFFSCWFLSYCCVVSTSHAINVVCTVSPVGAAWCRHSTCSQKSLPGTSLFTCDQITLMKKQGPRNSSSRLIAEREPLFFFICRPSLPTPAFTICTPRRPFFGSLSSRSILSIIIIIIIFLLKRSFFLFLFVLLPPFSLVCLTRTFLL